MGVRRIEVDPDLEAVLDGGGDLPGCGHGLHHRGGTNTGDLVQAARTRIEHREDRPEPCPLELPQPQPTLCGLAQARERDRGKLPAHHLLAQGGERCLYLAVQRLIELHHWLCQLAQLPAAAQQGSRGDSRHQSLSKPNCRNLSVRAFSSTMRTLSSGKPSSLCACTSMVTSSRAPSTVASCCRIS